MDETDARRTALAGLIDDAAVFPPARLALPDALAQHAAHRAREESWILGRFLVPASKLGALGAPDGLRIGVVSDGPDFDGDLRLARSTPDVTLEVIERRAGSPDEVRAIASPVPVFVELALDDDLEAGLDAVAAAGHGAKIRCGGLTADAFPSVEAVAGFLRATRERGLPFKATAGLHHPVRHLDADLGVERHGFLNLLAAVALGEEADEADVLAETDPAALTLDADGLRWRDRVAGPDALERARDRFVAYGSCSFDEPVDDLRGMGIL